MQTARDCQPTNDEREILEPGSSQGASRLVVSRSTSTNDVQEDVMPSSDKPLGQQYHEAVEALKARGLTNADAIRQVAEDFDKNVNAVRGGIHQYRSRANGSSGGTGRGRRAARKSVDDFIASARRELESALALIDSEVEDAKAALDAAQARLDDVTAQVKDKKADIEKRLKALS